ncbi:MAG: hypothetical protein ACFE9N_01665 [Promethearchaeota archaeon]
MITKEKDEEIAPKTLEQRVISMQRTIWALAVIVVVLLIMISVIMFVVFRYIDYTEPMFFEYYLWGPPYYFL